MPVKIGRRQLMAALGTAAAWPLAARAQQPNKRFATVEELGALSVFLASEAGASITGIALPVDGGWTAH